MLDEITWEQFMEWTAYAELEPFDEEREDLRSASVATVIANVNRGPGKAPFKLSDFVLKFGDAADAPAPKKPWQALRAIGRLIAAAFGADVEGNR